MKTIVKQRKPFYRIITKHFITIIIINPKLANSQEKKQQTNKQSSIVVQTINKVRFNEASTNKRDKQKQKNSHEINKQTLKQS